MSTLRRPFPYHSTFVPNPSIINPLTGALSEVPDFEGYRCLSPDEALKPGDLWVAPFGSDTWGEEFLVPRPDRIEGTVGVYASVGNHMVKESTSPGWWAYRARPGMALRKGNPHYAAPLPLP